MEAKLLGKLVVEGIIEARTGLRIGGSQGAFRMGALDLNVVTDPSGKPYVPGSALKGKLRSLLEYAGNCAFNENGGHMCSKEEDYKACVPCRLFGIAPGSGAFSVPTLTRLLVSDAPLANAGKLEEWHKQGSIELAYTEVKSETAIDRVMGKSKEKSIRQVERVPAGAEFSLRMILNVLLKEDLDELLKPVFEAMQLLEDDYLGAMGSRGYGRVAFKGLKVWWNSAADYKSGATDTSAKPALNGGMATPASLLKGFEELRKAIG